MKKALPFAIIALIIIIAGFFLPVILPPISVSAEHLFNIGPLNVTNALLTSWVVTIIIILFFFLASRNMQARPSGLQNFVEFMVEGIYNITESVSGREWAPRFFAIPATIFIFVLIINWFGLFIAAPLTGLGLCEGGEHGEESEHAALLLASTEGAQVAAEGEETVGTCAPGQHIVPFFRAPSADLNFTLALAVITQLASWYFGFAALGAGGYLGKFFQFGELTKAKSASGFALGLINFIVGLIEFLSEFVKIIAFTFRLFGNVFAGEVMLYVITALVPLLVITPLIGFEIFVGFIQAFVFFILSVAFYTVSVQPHGGEHH